MSIQRYEEVIGKIQRQWKQVIIGSDQNFDYMKVNDHRPTGILLDTFISFGLAPCITRPTRVTKSATLIDNLYISANFYKDCSSGILFSDISDHFPIFVCVGVILDDTVFIRLRELLYNEDWDFTQELNINDAFIQLHNILRNNIETLAPQKKILLFHSINKYANLGSL